MSRLTGATTGFIHFYAWDLPQSGMATAVSHSSWGTASHDLREATPLFKILSFWKMLFIPRCNKGVTPIMPDRILDPSKVSWLRVIMPLMVSELMLYMRTL